MNLQERMIRLYNIEEQTKENTISKEMMQWQLIFNNTYIRLMLRHQKNKLGKYWAWIGYSSECLYQTIDSSRDIKVCQRRTCFAGEQPQHQLLPDCDWGSCILLSYTKWHSNPRERLGCCFAQHDLSFAAFYWSRVQYYENEKIEPTLTG